ncbi:MAG TPA: TonB-dependent receptor [Paludibacter sp.]|nr:TonB-dependent receptor [Paludibacter sp.]
MKQTIIFLGFVLLSNHMLADLKGKVIDKKGDPVEGVNIHWLNTNIGVVSDKSGEFTLSPNTNTDQLIFSNVAYKSDTLSVANYNDKILVVLDENIQLSEVSVISKKQAVLKSRTSVFQTEKITATELCKAACCNLSESFETNPSVDVTYSDAATGAKQIKMLGLSGTYVQMLTENIPNLRGISSAYGLGFIPGPWMESIQVSKGTASVINGYEAITGQINVEYKKPQTSEIVAANVFMSNSGRIEANVNASAKISEYLSTGILLHASDELFELDENGDNFMDMPMVKQYNFINRWYFKRNDFTSQAFVRALSEKRSGGQIAGDYHIGIDTKRYEFFLKNGYTINHEKNTSLGFIVSGSLHNQNAMYGHKKYDGHQGNFYANLIYQTNFGENHKISAGTSFNFDNYNETLFAGQTSVFPRKEFVPGIFAEYTFNLNDKLILMSGLRADVNSVYGTIITPRFHAKYNVSDHLHFRANVGKGFHSPNVLAENNFLLASNRIINIDPDLKLEEAWNYGLSVQSYIPMFGKELNLSGEWYYTKFMNQTVVDMDSNPHEVNFGNLNGKSYSQSIQIEANMEIVKGLTLTIAHRLNDAKSTIGGLLREKPLTNRTKSLLTTSYQTPLKKWQFDFTAQFNGSGRLPDPDVSTPLWEKEYKPYTILNAQITKYFRTWSVYLGSENLTSFVQKNPVIDVINPMSDNFDASMVWGPMHGRKIYLGFRWALDRE